MMGMAYSGDRVVVGTSNPTCEFLFLPIVTVRLDPAGRRESPCDLRRRTVPTDLPEAQRCPSVMEKGSTMTAKDALWTDDPAQSRIAPINQNARVALGLLLQARGLAQNAGTELWDFALEIDRLFETGLTISDLRWLVAKRFAEHGQELSAYGAPHRSFRRGDGFFFDHTTCVILTPSGASFVDACLESTGRFPTIGSCHRGRVDCC